jgi:hypothetical protein
MEMSNHSIFQTSVPEPLNPQPTMATTNSLVRSPDRVTPNPEPIPSPTTLAALNDPLIRTTNFPGQVRCPVRCNMKFYNSAFALRLHMTKKHPSHPDASISVADLAVKYSTASYGTDPNRKGRKPPTARAPKLSSPFDLPPTTNPPIPRLSHPFGLPPTTNPPIPTPIPRLPHPFELPTTSNPPVPVPIRRLPHSFHLPATTNPPPPGFSRQFVPVARRTHLISLPPTTNPSIAVKTETREPTTGLLKTKTSPTKDPPKRTSLPAGKVRMCAMCGEEPPVGEFLRCQKCADMCARRLEKMNPRQGSEENPVQLEEWRSMC